MNRLLLLGIVAVLLSASVLGAVELSDPDALNALGYYLYKEGKFEIARGAFEHAIYFEPSFEEARSNLAVLLFEMKEYDTAEKQYEFLVAIDENNVQYWYDLGVVRIADFRYGTNELDDFYEGLAAYERAEELNPNYEYVQENLVVLYRIAEEFNL
ncbi:hypothetical protein GOV10_06220 [Candidatus Woesearchaeota archaeon]|nr:hypothetical protein [Candidatus Woesearchaeota archaeon]